MKKDPFYCRFWREISVLLLLTAGMLGCGAVSPPVGIPAPVSQLLSVSNPDANGTVTLTGAPGSVVAGADVTAANTTQGGVVQKLKLELVLYRTAHAGNGDDNGDVTAPLTNTAIAGPDGSFQLILHADIGDEIQVVQTVNGETSPPASIVVEGKSVDLGWPPRDLAVDPQTGRIFVTTEGDEDGFVFILNFIDEGAPLSLPQPDVTFSGMPGIGEIALDSVNDRGLVLFTSENSVINFGLTGGGQPVQHVVSLPLSVDILPDGFQAVIGAEDPLNSIWFYRMWQDPGLQCSVEIIDTLNRAAHVATPFVAIRRDALSVIQVLAVSEFDNGSFILSKFQFVDTCPTDLDVLQIPLPEFINPGGLVSFNQTDNALISDAGSNLVYVADFNDSSLSELQVGNGPRGIAVNENGTKAYVVNRGDNSLSAINLGDFSVQTQQGVALSPTEIGLLPGGTQAVLLSSGDQLVVLVDLEI
jgi:DNA-binding beta-propeller fold protein YncE